MSERRGRVLVVDDDELAARVVSRVLGKEHDIVEARSGQDALARIEAGERFDVVVCDLIMPKMTGMELHERVQRAGLDVADRMIFLTGGAFTARAAGFVAKLPPRRWLQKPFEAKDLRSLARDFVR